MSTTRSGHIEQAARHGATARRSRLVVAGPGPGEARLRELLRQPGCPVCSEGRDAEARYFFWLLNETTADPRALEQVAAAGAFCPEHGAMLASFKAFGEVTYVHAYAARRALRLLSAAAGGRGPASMRSRALIRTACPACAARDAQHRLALDVLERLLGIPPGGESGGPALLCFPHLQCLGSRAHGALLEQLVTRHHEATARLEDSVTPASPASRDAVLPWRAETRDPVAAMLDACESPDACPVCHEALRARGEWLAWLAEATTRGRDQLEDVLPTCPRHLRAATGHRSAPLAAAATAHALGAVRARLQLTIELLGPRGPFRGERISRWRLLRPVAERRRRSLARAALARPMHCPPCHREATAVDRALRLLLALLEQDAHRARYERGHGLCVRHFDAAQRLTPRERVSAFLIDALSAKLAVLQWELEESLRKNAWSARPEGPGAEQTSWLRALRRFSGILEPADAPGTPLDARGWP
ncbi:MAG TPA: hypothetical protein VEJ89_04415 [Myxococcaceae bacterium]|jgi:hypothetical protein|nr:hypothetical protein [Myxococcaceae bacterium]